MRFQVALLLGVSALACSVEARAADLIVDEPAVVATPAPSSIYVQLLGGVAAPLDATFYSAIDEAFPNQMDAGWALAGTLGVVVADGVSLEGDIFHTVRNYSDYDADISSTSIMANAKFTAELSEGFSVYAAAGVGALMIVDTYEGFDVHFNGFGYQLIAGATMAVADRISLVGEVRYQDSFDRLDGDETGTELHLPVAAALVGVKFGF